MMTETSFLTFSAGRDATKKKTGSLGLLGGVICELDGLASAKQTLPPPLCAAYAPHSPYWPSSAGCGPSTATVSGASLGARGFAAGRGGFGLAGAAAGFGAGVCCAA